MAAIELVDPLEKKNLLQDYQELVSDIVKLYPAHGDEELQVRSYSFSYFPILLLTFK